MGLVLFAAETVNPIGTLQEIFQRESRAVFSPESLLVLFVSLAVAAVLGRLAAALLRRLVAVIGRRADVTDNLSTVNRLRRLETGIVLSIASIRTLLLLYAIYFWWVTLHEVGQPTAVLGASAILVVVVGAAFGPVLRDIASGSVMMAEQWYGVGDHVRIEPFMEMQGVVERVSLRSTRIRGLNGEIMWVNNQHIQGVRIAPRGIRTLGLELFVNNLDGGRRLVEQVNKRLPKGPLLVTSPLTIISAEESGESLWHITAIAETAPGREWLIETSAVDLMKQLDENAKKPVIAHGPLPRYADFEAERKFSRTIHNARKRPKPRRSSADVIAKAKQRRTAAKT